MRGWFFRHNGKGRPPGLPFIPCELAPAVPQASLGTSPIRLLACSRHCGSLLRTPARCR